MSPPRTDGDEPRWAPMIREVAHLIGGDFAGRLQVAIESETAALAEPEHPPLDVERLAGAVEIVGGRSFDLRASRRDVEQIAAEYTRLASQSSVTQPDE